MSDLIRVIDLEVWSRIGVPEEERASPQRLLVSIEMRVGSLAEAARSDDLAATVNYFAVAQQVKAMAEENRAKLLESLAERMAQQILAGFPVLSVKLEIKKFVLPETRWVSVEIERESKGAGDPSTSSG